MKKLRKRILEIAILLTVVSSTLPFFCHDVYADTISQSDIQGVERVLVNSTYLDQTVINAGNTYKYYSFDYEVTVLLKDYYLGWIQGIFQTSFKTFDNANWQVQNSSCTTVSKSYYVNDNKFKSSFTITAWVLVNQQGNVDPAGSYTTSFTLSNSNVVAYQDLNSIDTVIDLLQDVNQYVSIDVLSELQTIVSNTNISNQYLEIIAKCRQWNFPIESYSFNYFLLKQNYTVVNIVNYQYYIYPIFQISNGDLIENRYVNAGQSYMFIVGMDDIPNQGSEVTNWFTLSSGSVSSYEIINRTSNFGICKFIVSNITPGSFTLRANRNMHLMAIFSMRSDYYNKKYFSTDFALLYGLSNNLLDDLHIIAQGTQGSNTSSSNLEDQTDDINDISDQMFRLEDSFNDDLQDNLQQIDTSFDVGNQFGSKFLYSANWVRTQFNNLTNLNPFGSLLSFSLLLGIGLLIIGKVLG